MNGRGQASPWNCLPKSGNGPTLLKVQEDSKSKQKENKPLEQSHLSNSLA